MKKSKINIEQIQLLLGKKVHKLRKKKDLSQHQLAQACEIHYTYISSVERGLRNVSLVNLVKIATALSCTVSDLLEGI